ncbi:S-adenosylmethionine:tRNA ribosyltransferase-isomerase [Rhizomonospora bruguierae]|uniref:S-adenosylmethionine:tRNA ribosyltransferase-isomerase n=1 Tax=Rhizomonospora bruguierae TaxID=1581705 RepID=UPI00278C5405|nr:S-adenosylmethionine:tRNA ribosyltransferase-isomerase [Micromonospora sp. NBRC 107566]
MSPWTSRKVCSPRRTTAWSSAMYPERYFVPATTARLVNQARAAGGRIIAAGTTAVRALETAAAADGTLAPAAGWTDLVVTPARGVRAVDGLLTGFHEPRASHLLMLTAIAGTGLLAACYREALDGGYLWHEFAGREPHRPVRRDTVFHSGAGPTVSWWPCSASARRSSTASWRTPAGTTRMRRAASSRVRSAPTSPPG